MPRADIVDHSRDGGRRGDLLHGRVEKAIDVFSEVYAVDINRPADPQRLTERGWWNVAAMDAAATRLIVTRSNPDQPTQIYLADTTGKRIAWVNENAIRPGHPYQPFLASHRPTQFGTLKAADGSTLHWKMITPPLEPGRR